MPFDVLPQEAKVGKFQRFADALLRGCKSTSPGRGVFYFDGAACAVGAMAIGDGTSPERFNTVAGIGDIGRYWLVMTVYGERYGSSIYEDNDSGNFTREQIAARIAAL